MTAAQKTSPCDRPRRTPRPPSARQRVKTATSATSGWAARLKAVLERDADATRLQRR